MNLRSAVPIATVISLAAPLTAHAATLDAGRSCYGAGQQIMLAGTGYTPGSLVSLTARGRQAGLQVADAAGSVTFPVIAPSISGKSRSEKFTAADDADPSQTATDAVTLTSLGVKVTPQKAEPSKPRRIAAHGFLGGGGTLYAHVRLGRKTTKNIRIGKLKGPCRTLSVKRRLFGASAKSGLYQIQFDTKRRYKANTIPRVTSYFTIFRTFRLSRTGG